MRPVKRPGRVHCRRRGAAAVEVALVTLIFATTVLAMIDLGVGVCRYNQISEAARQGARRAIVRGKLAGELKDNAWKEWGPPAVADYPGSNPYTVTADNQTDDIAAAVRPFLSGLDLKDSRITVWWPGPNPTDPKDDDNEPEMPVRVMVTGRYRPITTLFLEFDVRATSTMTISH